jgi:cell division protein FtsN
MQGLIVGLLIGLVLSLAVAMYVNKVPLPFVDKVPQRTPEQDAAEVQNNKNWDPNAPLYGDNPAKAKAIPQPVPEEVVSSEESASGASAPSADAPASAASKAAAKPQSKASAPAASGAADPAAILSGGGVSTQAPATALTFYVQAGAYSTSSEAEEQRAKIAIMGLEPRISEREVKGRTMFRVRLGPFSSQEDAESARLSLAGGGVESALVRIQK